MNLQILQGSWCTTSSKYALIFGNNSDVFEHHNHDHRFHQDGDHCDDVDVGDNGGYDVAECAPGCKIVMTVDVKHVRHAHMSQGHLRKFCSFSLPSIPPSFSFLRNFKAVVRNSSQHEKPDNLLKILNDNFSSLPLSKPTAAFVHII